MHQSPQIEPRSTNSLLACLGLAIDETKLIKAIENSRKMISHLEANNPVSERLFFLKRDLSNLEAQLAKIRSNAVSAITETSSPQMK